LSSGAATSPPSGCRSPMGAAASQVDGDLEAARRRAKGQDAEELLLAGPVSASRAAGAGLFKSVAGLSDLVDGEAGMRFFLEDAIGGVPLPRPWAMQQRPEGCVLFLNCATGATSWRHPLEASLQELLVAGRHCLSLPTGLREEAVSNFCEQWSCEAKVEYEKWYSVPDDSGHPYYCHRETGEAMWEHPAEVLLPSHYMKIKSLNRLRDERYAWACGGGGRSVGSTSLTSARSWPLMAGQCFPSDAEQERRSAAQRGLVEGGEAACQCDSLVVSTPSAASTEARFSEGGAEESESEVQETDSESWSWRRSGNLPQAGEVTLAVEEPFEHQLDSYVDWPGS